MAAPERSRLTEMWKKNFFKTDSVVCRGKGCDKCNNSGYYGRIGIHEVLVPDGSIRDAVLNKAPASEIRRLAIAQGMTTMLEDGLLKVQAGETALEEILRMRYE